MSSPTDRRRLEEAVLELRWRRYAEDAEAWFRDCVWIPSQRDPRGREKFELFDYQEGDLRTLLGNRYVVGLKARQIGWSTLIAAALLHRSLFRPGSVCLWLSNNQDNANKAVGMLETMWHFLPQWVKARAPELTSNQASKKEWTFPDGMTSRIRALAGTSTAGASETASIAVLDEFGLVDGPVQEDLFRSVEPTTDAGGQLWILSTARGAYNRFATLFKAAQRGESKYVPMFRPWTVSRFVNAKADDASPCDVCTPGAPGPDPACGTHVDRSRYEAKAREFAAKPWLFHAEYPESPEEAFRESGNPRFAGLPPLEECFDGWIRGRLEGVGGPQDPPLFVPDEAGALRLREDLVDGPDDWREYVAYVDPAKGVGGDYTAAHVLTMTEDGPDIVAWWHHNRIEAVEASRDMDLLGRFFGGSRRAALLAIESTGGWGESFITELQVHRGYPNLYRHTLVGSTTRRPQQRIGFPMNVNRRPLVIDKLAEWLLPHQMVGHIHPLLRHELGTFVRTEDGKVQADVGCHDDLVMSLAGAVWLACEHLRATTPPKVEEPAPTPGRHSLRDLFDALAEKQAAVEVRHRRETQRMNRRFERSSRRSKTRMR